jgi:hypothetical protein
MSFKVQLQELEKQTAQVKALKAQINADREAELASLPDRFGYPDLPSFIKAVRGACGARPPKAREPGKRPTAQPLAPVGQGLAKSAEAVAPKPPVNVASPIGTSLDDPANFGLLPDAALLQLDLAKDPAKRQLLTEALSFANRVLHTSKVPAPVWRAWREFEKRIQERLRTA